MVLEVVTPHRVTKRRSTRVPIATIISHHTITLESSSCHAMRASTCVHNEQEVDNEMNSTQHKRMRDNTHMQRSESASERRDAETLHVVVDAVAVEHDASRVSLHHLTRGSGGVHVAKCVNEDNKPACDANMDARATTRMSHAYAHSRRCDEDTDAHRTPHTRSIGNACTYDVTTMGMRINRCIADVHVPAKQQRHAMAHAQQAQRYGAREEDGAAAAASAKTTQAAAAIATTTDVTSSAAATVTAQREDRERSRDIAKQLEAITRDCTEINTGNSTTKASNTPNPRDSGDPASPELLVKVNKTTRKNLRKYEQKVRELRGYIKRADKKINNATYRNTQRAHIRKQQQRSHQRSLKIALARVKRDSEITRTNSSLEAGGTARKRRRKNGHMTR